MATGEKTGSLISVAGKTYSLFGSGSSTAEYYQKIGTLADRLLEHKPDIPDLIRTLEQASRKKRLLKKQLRAFGSSSDEFIHLVVTTARDLLAPHTALVNAHLKELYPVQKAAESEFSTTMEAGCNVGTSQKSVTLVA